MSQTGGPYWLGEGPTYLWIPSPWEVSIRMDIILPPPAPPPPPPHWTTLSNCPSTNDLAAVLKPKYIESVKKFEK